MFKTFSPILLLVIFQLVISCVAVQHGDMKVEGSSDGESSGSSDYDGGSGYDIGTTVTLPINFSVLCTATTYMPTCGGQATMCSDASVTVPPLKDATAGNAAVRIKWKKGKCSTKSSETVAEGNAGYTTVQGYVSVITSGQYIYYNSTLGNKLPYGDYCRYVLLDEDWDGSPDTSPPEPLYVTDKTYSLPATGAETATCDGTTDTGVWRDATNEDNYIWN